MKHIIKSYGKKIEEYAKNNYRLCFREADDALKHPFIGTCSR